MKRLRHIRGFAIALALHAGAIGVAWFGLSQGQAGQQAATVFTQEVAVAYAATPETADADVHARAAAMPPARAFAAPEFGRPDSEDLRPPLEPPPPTPEPDAEQAVPEPVSKAAHRPAHAAFVRANPNRVEPSKAIPNESPTGSGTPAPALWVAPAILKWQAPEVVREGFTGRVIAVLAIDAGGHVTSVKLEQGTHSIKLDELLIKSFESAQCRPAARDGKPTAGELRQPVDFK